MRFIVLQAIVCTLVVVAEAGTHPDYILTHHLWTQTLQEREAAQDSSLITGLISTKLNPVSFGSFVIQDVVYIYNSKRIIGLALQRAKDATDRSLLQKMSNRYEKLSDYMLQTWPIKYPSGVRLGKACSKYLNHLYDMATNYDAVYFITAMLPRYQLWPWLGIQLQTKQNDFGVYTEWVTTNLNASYTGYTDLETVINEAETLGRINRTMARNVFKQSMESERDFLSSVP